MSIWLVYDQLVYSKNAAHNNRISSFFKSGLVYLGSSITSNHGSPDDMFVFVELLIHPPIGPTKEYHLYVVVYLFGKGPENAEIKIV